MQRLLLIIGFVMLLLSCFAQETKTNTDTQDGKVYKIVKIGTQTRFAENLAYKPSRRNYWTYNNNQVIDFD